MNEWKEGPNGVIVRVGQKWMEMDHRIGIRVVRVVGFAPRMRGGVLVQCVAIEYGDRRTFATLDRFNGRSGGYKLVSK